MSESATTDDQVLGELARMLASPQIPVQKRIAQDLGVDQPFVSNARNGKLKRVTPRVAKLHEYATMRITAAEAANSAAADMDSEIAEASNSPDMDKPSEVRSVRATGDGERRYERDALTGVKAYLADGYDPRLIVEQLAVLRRAQQLRRPGREPLSQDDRGR